MLLVSVRAVEVRFSSFWEREQCQPCSITIADNKKQVPDFRAGDTVHVAVRIVKGDKERVQEVSKASSSPVRAAA